MNTIKIILSIGFSSLISSMAFAQADDITRGIEEYRALLEDGNPADLYSMEGAELWTTARGPNNVSLEKCDLGLGPGIVDGASAQMPRYFKDTGKVQDVESRLLSCMVSQQGFDPAVITKAASGKGERASMESIVAYIVSRSKGLKINVNANEPHMKKMIALGEKAFFMRAGSFDFACATCHGEDNKRIRLQDLPNLTKAEGAAKGYGSWPAYRVSNGQFWTMQKRLEDCYRQQRLPEPVFASDITVALSAFMAAKGNGGEIRTPGIKR